jgi:hypothetical protein
MKKKNGEKKIREKLFCEFFEEFVKIISERRKMINC